MFVSVVIYTKHQTFYGQKYEHKILTRDFVYCLFFYITTRESTNNWSNESVKIVAKFTYEHSVGVQYTTVYYLSIKPNGQISFDRNSALSTTRYKIATDKYDTFFRY